MSQQLGQISYWNEQLQNEASVLQHSEHCTHHLPTFTYQDNTIPLSLPVSVYAASNTPDVQPTHLWPLFMDVCMTKCHWSALITSYHHLPLLTR